MSDFDHWNHRVTRELLDTGEYEYAIREVHYGADDKVVGWTADPIAAVGDTAEEVAQVLEQMRDCLQLGVLDLESRETLP